MKVPEAVLWIVIGVIVTGALLVSLNQPNGGGTNPTPTYVIEKPKNVQQEGPPQERIELRDGFPAVVSFCSHGLRVYSQYIKSSQQGDVALWGYPDNQCPRE